ncbi:hypothetical protein AB6A23_13390 [Paenibacillus tarimensis]
MKFRLWEMDKGDSNSKIPKGIPSPIYSTRGNIFEYPYRYHSTCRRIDIPENAYNLAVVADGRAFAGNGNTSNLKNNITWRERNERTIV